MSYKPHIQSRCLAEGGCILLQIKPNFILGDIKLKLCSSMMKKVNQIRL